MLHRLEGQNQSQSELSRLRSRRVINSRRAARAMVRSAVIEDATAASSQRLTLPLVGSIAYHATIGLPFTLVLLQAGALGGAHAVGLVVGLPMFMMVASSSFWGSMADRWRNRKRVVLLSVVLSSLLVLPMPFVGIWGLIGLRVLHSFFRGGVVHLHTLFAELDASARGAQLGRLQMTAGFGWGLGGLLGGLLVSVEEYGSASPSLMAAFFVNSALGIFAAAALMQLRERSWMEQEQQFDTVHDDRSVLPERAFNAGVPLPPLVVLWRLWPLWMATVFLFVGYQTFLSFAPIFFTTLTGNTSRMGLVMFASGLVHGVTAMRFGRLADQYQRETLLRLVCLGFVTCMATYTLNPHPLIVIAAFLPPIWMAFDVSATSLVADRLPYRLRGRGVGILNSCMFLGAGSGALLGGALRHSMSFEQVFGAGTLMVTFGFLIAIYATRSTEIPRA